MNCRYCTKPASYIHFNEYYEVVCCEHVKTNFSHLSCVMSDTRTKWTPQNHFVLRAITMLDDDYTKNLPYKDLTDCDLCHDCGAYHKPGEHIAPNSTLEEVFFSGQLELSENGKVVGVSDPAPVFDPDAPVGQFTKRLMKLSKAAVNKFWGPDNPLQNMGVDSRMRKADCPECKGTGKYIGFNKVECCRTCKGDTVL